MPITSSQNTIDAHTQADGSRYVIETHTDSTGRVHSFQYSLPAGQGTTEADAFMNARVAGIDAQLADSEFEGALDGA